MIVGMLILCGLGPLETNTVDGCKPFVRLFPTVEVCEQASEDVRSTELGVGTYVAYTDCRNLGDGA